MIFKAVKPFPVRGPWSVLSSKEHLCDANGALYRQWGSALLFGFSPGSHPNLGEASVVIAMEQCASASAETVSLER